MKRLKLTKGLYATIDDEDFERANKYSWHAIQKRRNGKFYAERSYRKNGIRKNERLHHFIYGEVRMLDHIDGDGLNNTKVNLRPCTASQNSCNIAKTKRKTTSIYKGVTRRRNSWRATICYSGRSKELGSFRTEIEAANAYNKAALIHHGVFAVLNSIKK